MLPETPRVLFYGYGNPGRQDDGLASEFIQRTDELNRPDKILQVDTDCNYQLNIEDAEVISKYDIVLFIDASQESIEDFMFSRVRSDEKVAFTTHSASPGYVLHLCETLFNQRPSVWLLHIRGYEWNFQEGLSDQALKNLNKAFEFVKTCFLKASSPDQVNEILSSKTSP